MSKQESLLQIITSEQPDIIALCETKLGTLSKPKIQGYEIEYLNHSRGKEGLLVAAKEGVLLSMENVTNEENEDRNIIAVQVKYPNLSLRVIVAHAPQETDKIETRERFFPRFEIRSGTRRVK